MKTLKLKKEVVSILENMEMKQMKGGGATDPTVIPLTQDDYCNYTKKNCETQNQLALCDTGVSCPCILTKDCQVTNDDCQVEETDICPLNTYVFGCEG